MTNQRGSILIYGLIALAMVTICGGAVYTYQRAIVRAERAERDLTVMQTAHQEQLAENEMLRQAKARLDKALAVRQAERDTVAALERKIDAKLSTIYRTDPVARQWADTAVPQSVVDGLRAESAGASPQNRARETAAKPAAALGGR
jgi:Tfp pilus assembly protein PilE